MRALGGSAMPAAGVGDVPTVCVFGAGLAGLTAALKIKSALPEVAVVLVEKPIPESNTQLSGMRLRIGIPHQRSRPREEVLALLARRNGGQVTPPMRQFADVVVAELRYWQDLAGFVEHHDRPEWFGPQWGRANRAGYGRGRSVLDWLRQAAVAAGVCFLSGALRRLVVEDGRVTAAVLVHHGESGPAPAMLRAGGYVLANGSAAGLLFSSTNKKIHWSGHEVAFGSGLALNGSTLHMIHPFGNAGPDGASRVGCLETDLLAESTVWLTDHDGREHLDEETTGLLAQHEAHDHFPTLTRRLSAYRAPVLLRDPSGRITHARVAQHYHHLGIRTVDGLRIDGARNAYAVGDAAGIGHWTNFRERQPGFALSKCLVDAALLADMIKADAPSSPGELRSAGPELLDESPARADTVRRMPTLNAGFLFELVRAERVRDKVAVAARWADRLRLMLRDHGSSSLGLLSLAMAQAHADVLSGAVTEPIDLTMTNALVSTVDISGVVAG